MKMKLYLKLSFLPKLGYDNKLGWIKYGMILHAMFSKKPMSKEEICWQYMRQDLDQDCQMFDYTNLKGSMIAIEKHVEEGLSRLIEVCLVKEMQIL